MINFNIHFWRTKDEGAVQLRFCILFQWTPLMVQPSLHHNDNEISYPLTHPQLNAISYVTELFKRNVNWLSIPYQIWVWPCLNDQVLVSRFSETPKKDLGVLSAVLVMQRGLRYASSIFRLFLSNILYIYIYMFFSGWNFVLQNTFYSSKFKLFLSFCSSDLK